MVLANTSARVQTVTCARRAPAAEARPRRQPRLRAYVAVILFCLALFAANAILHGLVTINSVQVDDLTARLGTAEQYAEESELELAYLSSYPRIAKEAESRLAMHAPDPGELHFVAMSPAKPSVAVSHTARPQNTGLVASLGTWLRGLGRADASPL